MRKYKNIAKLNLVVSIKRDLTLLKPGDIIELDSIPPGYDGYLAEEDTKPVEAEVNISDIVDHQNSDLPDDFIVVIDDEIVDSLRSEDSSQTQKKPRRRRTKR